MASDLSTIGTKRLPKFLFEFLKNPIETLKIPSRLSWTAALTLQTIGAITSGILVAAFEQRLTDLWIAVFLFPLITLMIGAIFTLALYFYFAFFARTYLDMRRLYSLVVTALLPYFLIHAFSGFLAPLDLIGFALSSLCLVVGLVEQFRLGLKPVLILITAAAAVFFLLWSALQIFSA